MPGLLLPFYPWPELIGKKPGTKGADSQPINFSSKADIRDIDSDSKKIDRDSLEREKETDPKQLKVGPKIDKIDNDPKVFENKPNLQDENI